MVSKDVKIWANACNSLGLLAQVTGEYLTAHIHILMGQLNTKLSQKAHRDTVMNTLQLIEHNCGPDAAKLIKQKCPTYVSM